MVKIVRIGDTFVLVRARVNIGFIKDRDTWYMIDSGLDDDQARRALNSVEEYVTGVSALLNTHSHADHIGGNSYINKKLKIPIYSSKIEASIGSNTILEPIILYGGCPPKDLKNKFLMAKSSPVEVLNSEMFNFQVIDLKGHSPGMVGFINDEIAYVADAYLDKNLVYKHKIPYNFNPGDAIKSLYYIRDLISKGYMFIPSHGSPERDPEEHVESNINAILKVKDLMIEYLKQSRDLNQIISYIFKSLEIKINELSIFYLYKSSIMGYLTWLYQDGLIEIIVESGKEIYKLKRS